MPKTNTLPGKLRKAVLKHMGSHLDAHLRAPHFEHIRRVHERARRPGAGRRKAKSHKILKKLDVYTATLPVAARGGIDQITPEGCVVLAESAEGLCTQVEVQKSGNKYSVVRVSTGPLADSLASAVQKAESSRTSKAAGTPEFRILSVPAMHVFGVWAHYPRRGRKDLFIATMSNFIGLRVQRKYGLASVQRLLQRQATTVILRWYEQQHEPGGIAEAHSTNMQSP